MQRHSQKGQAILEFVFTCFISLGFIFFFFKFGLFLAFGNLTHYATFMAARSFLASSQTSGLDNTNLEFDDHSQVGRARSTLQYFLKNRNGSTDLFPSIAKGNPSFSSNTLAGMDINHPLFDKKNLDYYWLQGIRYQFQGTFDIFSWSTQSTNKPSLTLTAESFLGREPSIEECQNYMQGSNGGLEDNGC